MEARLRLLCIIVTIGCFTFGLPLYGVGLSSPAQPFLWGKLQDRTLGCTKEALTALKSIPKLNYRCGEEQQDEIKDSSRRRAALRAYLTKLESAATALWWAAPIDDLNACAVTHEARPLTDSEHSEFDSSNEVSGDQSVRFLVVPDPCVKYSYITRNGFVLVRAGGRVYATQVVDAFYTRFDPGVEMQLARQEGETLVIVETSSEPTPTTLFGDSIGGIGENTLSVYAIDPGTHRAVPRNLFRDKGKLTNVFKFEGYLLSDEELSKQWHAPELVHNGMLSPRFKIYSLADSGDEANPRPRFVVETYVWNGQYYAVQAKRPRSPVRR